MWRGAVAIVVQLSTLASIQGWLCVSLPRRALHSSRLDFRRVIMSSRDAHSHAATPIITVEDTWPQLAGRQTCATAAAGKVIKIIRVAWSCHLNVAAAIFLDSSRR